MSKEEQYFDERLRWIDECRVHNINPYPNHFRRTAIAEEMRKQFGGTERKALEEKTSRVSMAGRIVGKREMGATGFASIRDMSGDIQFMVGKKFTHSESFSMFEQAGIGDIVGATGHITKTMKGELTLRVEEFFILVRSLHPLPKEYYGFKDVENRYRKRYEDLIVNSATREVFRKRFEIISELRHYLNQRQFIEVETPMLLTSSGGATARPFSTHHNALNLDMYLRVAPELFLKRLVIGGMEQVYEINRNFRNEGVSTRHNPEFTMLEFYKAYADYKDLMKLSEDMLRTICEKVHKTTTLEYQGERYDFAKPFERLTMKEAILRYNEELDESALDDQKMLTQYIKSRDIKIKGKMDTGNLLTVIFERTVEHQLQQPTFITMFPLAVSPLARCNEEVPEFVDRFELFIAGMEVANGFSELNDSEDQKRRLQEQALNKAEGDDEAMHYDADYIEALEYGLPPTAGEGIGIDRLVMLFTDAPSIRDVILFPHMRPKES